jgi:hypothetical protein
MAAAVDKRGHAINAPYIFEWRHADGGLEITEGLLAIGTRLTVDSPL